MCLKIFLHQMLSGLEVCHAHRIIHRDIKPQNLLVEGDTLKIADFGTLTWTRCLHVFVCLH